MIKKKRLVIVNINCENKGKKLSNLFVISGKNYESLSSVFQLLVWAPFLHNFNLSKNHEFSTPKMTRDLCIHQIASPFTSALVDSDVMVESYMQV